MKKRLDVLLYEKGLAPSREKARAIIMTGNVYINNQKCDKPGQSYDEASDIEVRESNLLKYVSRGGFKLEKAMNVFPIDLCGKVCMDIGSSTGGFTDCMLQNGAQKVYCVDVGYGQLAWKLRQDDRCVVMEKTNIRNVKRDDVQDCMDFISIDVSFISLKIVLPVAKTLMGASGQIVALVKPQFEAGKEQVGKKGVVRDPEVHREVIEKAVGYALDSGFCVNGISFSPIKGPEGNIEFLLFLENNDTTSEKVSIEEKLIIDTVNAAHEQLDKS